MKAFAFLAIILVASCSQGPKIKKSQETESFTADPKISFTVTEGILHPESALYSKKHDSIFVSNVASGNPTETKRVGYISKLAPDGKVIKSKWVTNLKAPKGMAIVKDHLYVSDVNEVVKIDILKGKILKTWKVKNAQFLNDVVADAKGNVYVSDMNANVIHIIKNDKLTDWIRSPKLRGPNGLFTDGSEHILMGQWGSEVDPKTWVAKKPGHLTVLSLKEKNPEVSEQKSLTGHLDGIDSDTAGNLYVSDWINGDVWKVKKTGEATKRFNFGQGTADISVAKELNLLLIPQMSQNKIIAVEL